MGLWTKKVLEFCGTETAKQHGRGCHRELARSGKTKQTGRTWVSQGVGDPTGQAAGVEKTSSGFGGRKELPSKGVERNA